MCTYTSVIHTWIGVVYFTYGHTSTVCVSGGTSSDRNALLLLIRLVCLGNYVGRPNHQSSVWLDDLDLALRVLHAHCVLPVVCVHCCGTRQQVHTHLRWSGDQSFDRGLLRVSDYPVGTLRVHTAASMQWLWYFEATCPSQHVVFAYVRTGVAPRLFSDVSGLFDPTRSHLWCVLSLRSHVWLRVHYVRISSKGVV